VSLSVFIEVCIYKSCQQ